ncbi:hypothetical protein COLO4_37723 [Corchorus olitorius]|uniref:Uncharacterized protein n=1 Tax=Corchorus olitorius TaxID=93759 RepID=A0A1R3FZS2_9ROSI|nr:hypothetical protein COLO4_37723 [Corchorus olitorius]
MGPVFKYVIHLIVLFQTPQTDLQSEPSAASDIEPEDPIASNPRTRGLDLDLKWIPQPTCVYCVSSEESMRVSLCTSMAERKKRKKWRGVKIESVCEVEAPFAEPGEDYMWEVAKEKHVEENFPWECQNEKRWNAEKLKQSKDIQQYCSQVKVHAASKLNESARLQSPHHFDKVPHLMVAEVHLDHLEFGFRHLLKVLKPMTISEACQGKEQWNEILPWYLFY